MLVTEPGRVRLGELPLHVDERRFVRRRRLHPALQERVVVRDPLLRRTERERRSFDLRGERGLFDLQVQALTELLARLVRQAVEVTFLELAKEPLRLGQIGLVASVSWPFRKSACASITRSVFSTSKST